MQLQLNVQKPAASVFGAGASVVPNAGQFGDAFFSEIRPRFSQLVRAGLVYGVQYASAATAAASATTLSSFTLFNPASSGVSVELIDIALAFASLAATTTTLVVGVQLFGNQTPTGVGAGNTPQNLAAGSSNAAQAKTYISGTVVGAPTTVARVVGSMYFDLAAGDVIGGVKDQIDGGIILLPNSGLELVSVAGTPTIIPSLTWAEIPI